MTSASKSQDNTAAWILAGLAFVVALMGAVFIGVGVLKNRRARRSLSWPSTLATLVSSGWSTYRAPGESQAPIQSSTTIRYSVAGRTYEFQRSGLLRLETTGQAGDEPYLPNSTVRVYYDPSDPADHEFEFSRGQTSRAFEVVGGISMLVALPFFFIAARMCRRRPRA